MGVRSIPSEKTGALPLSIQYIDKQRLSGNLLISAYKGWLLLKVSCSNLYLAH